jgi:hypothetical protein
MANFRGTRQVGRVEDLSEAQAAGIAGALTISRQHQINTALMHEARAIRLVPYDVSRAPRAEAAATRGNTPTRRRMLAIDACAIPTAAFRSTLDPIVELERPESLRL